MTIHLQANSELDEALRALSEHDEQVIVERDGQPLAILVSPRYMEAFLELAEEIEDRLDARAAAKAEEEFIASGENSIAYEDIRKSLGL